jgi:hypothetical protein
VVTITFQSVFHLEMHQNNVFFKLFLTSTHQNNLKISKNINLKQKKSNFSKIFLKHKNKQDYYNYINNSISHTT